MAPRIAIIVPAYGVACHLGEALTSLLAQTLKAWECVVIDDGAPEDVAQAVTPFLDDPRIRFISTENRGVSAARNRAIAETSAPLIALLDGDDMFHPDYLSKMVAAYDAHPDIRIATCNAIVFGEVTHEHLCFTDRQGSGDGATGTLTDVLDRSFRVYIGSTFRRTDFVVSGGFDVSLTRSEDFDLWVRLMMLGGVAHFIAEPLGRYRVRGGSASSNPTQMLEANIKVYRKAFAALGPYRAESTLLDRLIVESETALRFEQAIDRVIAGDAKGCVTQLRANSQHTSSIAWRVVLILSRLYPPLAGQILRWRRRVHRRSPAKPAISTFLPFPVDHQTQKNNQCSDGQQRPGGGPNEDSKSIAPDADFHDVPVS